MRARRVWTPAEDAEVVRLRAAAIPAPEIARRLGRTRDQITWRFSKLVARGVAPPMTPAERSRRAGRATAARRDDLWTAEEDAELVRAWNAGAMPAEIAGTVDRPISSIAGRVAALRARGVVGRMTIADRKVRERRARAAITDAKHEEARALVAACETTESFGYVVGLLYGDAFVHVCRMSVALKCTNGSFADSFARALEQSVGGPVKRLERVEPIKVVGDHEYRDVRYFEVYLHRRHVTAALVAMLGDTTKLGWRLDVDAAMRRGPAFCAGLIRGLFDSDGSFELRGRGIAIRYGSTNPLGAPAVHALMERMGFDVGLGTPSAKGEMRVSVRAASAERYATEISSGIDYKRAKLEQFLALRSRGPRSSRQSPEGSRVNGT